VTTASDCHGRSVGGVLKHGKNVYAGFDGHVQLRFVVLCEVRRKDRLDKPGDIENDEKPGAGIARQVFQV